MPSLTTQRATHEVPCRTLTVRPRTREGQTVAARVQGRVGRADTKPQCRRAPLHVPGGALSLVDKSRSSRVFDLPRTIAADMVFIIMPLPLSGRMGGAAAVEARISMDDPDKHG